MPRSRAGYAKVAIGSFFGTALFLFSLPHAFAAALYFSPASENVTLGSIFTVSVDVSSTDRAMNAASGDVSFPSDKLHVLSVTTVNSTMNLWVQNPSFTNTVGGGDVSFAGIVLNPGFTGIAGNIITIRFEALAIGDAPLAFSTGSVLANDGNGTNILNSLGTADITISPAPPVSPVTPVVPPAPVVTTTAITSTLAATTSTASSSLGTGRWLGDSARFLIEWASIIALALLLLALIIALIYYLLNRLRHFQLSLRHRLLKDREELRADLKRIEKELQAGHPESEVDLRINGRHRKQSVIREEMQHLEEDLKREIEKE